MVNARLPTFITSKHAIFLKLRTPGAPFRLKLNRTHFGHSYNGPPGRFHACDTFENEAYLSVALLVQQGSCDESFETNVNLVVLKV